MKLAALVLAASVGAGDAPPSSSQQDVTITIPAAEVVKCHAEGGCALFTRAAIHSLQQQAFEAGKESGTRESDSACYRSRKEV